MASSPDIRAFLLSTIPENPRDVAAIAADRFGISRQAVNRHLRQLIDDGLVRAQGRTRGRTYELVQDESVMSIPLSPPPEEDRIWREWAAPQLEGLRRNVRDICQFGFTEMVNNVVDHSEGDHLILGISRTPIGVKFNIMDDGIGIFRKIQGAFDLEDERHAVLELSKGKLTTDPSRHSGEGIFFTSRMFDTFGIVSGSLFLCHMPDDSDWLVERVEPREGTLIQLEIASDADRTVKEVFDRFTNTVDDYGFDITHVPVALAQHGDENLVSRSQAKRLLARVDRFRKVILDFEDVRVIGQAFADEVFRVFQQEHPDIAIVHRNANSQVEQMIRRAVGRLDR